MWGYGLDSSSWAQGPVVGYYENSNERPGSMKCREFLDHLTVNLLGMTLSVWGKWSRNSVSLSNPKIHILLWQSPFDPILSQLNEVQRWKCVEEPI
jgi:hypothetical protein